MQHFEILSYTPTPGQKQVGFFVCRYYSAVVAYRALQGKEGGFFFSTPSFKPYENGDWINGFELDSKIEDNGIKASLSHCMKMYPRGFDKQTSINKVGSVFEPQPAQGSQQFKNSSQSPANAPSAQHAEMLPFPGDEPPPF